MHRPMFMPAEWSRHMGCLILYPHNKSVFRGDNCEYARSQVRNVARAISSLGDPVTLFCPDDRTASEAKERFLTERSADDTEPTSISIRVLPSDDSWARDTCPMFVVPRKGDGSGPSPPSGSEYALAGIDWGFNAYGGPEGGCYWPCEKDKMIPKESMAILSRDWKLPIYRFDCQDHILEGGSVHVDGEGTVLTTEECNLNKNRNPNLSKDQIESKILHMLGAVKMIWLPRGLYGDADTNGHIDNFCCFVKPGHVALAWTEDRTDPQYDISNEALSILEHCTDAKGRKLLITKIHTPPPMFYTKEMLDGYDMVEREEGERMAASYINFYIANEGVVIPGFGDKDSDDRAFRDFSKIFPDRKVLQVPSQEILFGGGNIHCITQQVPALPS